MHLEISQSTDGVELCTPKSTLPTFHFLGTPIILYYASQCLVTHPSGFAAKFLKFTSEISVELYLSLCGLVNILGISLVTVKSCSVLTFFCSLCCVTARIISLKSIDLILSFPSIEKTKHIGTLYNLIFIHRMKPIFLSIQGLL